MPHRDIYATSWTGETSYIQRRHFGAGVALPSLELALKDMLCLPGL
jgi:hypothetical protein